MDEIAQLFTKRYPLFVLLLGILVAILATSEKVVVSDNSIEIAEGNAKFLWLIALLLIALAVYLIIKIEPSKEIEKSQKDTGKWNRAAFLKQGEKLDELDRVIASIRHQVEGGNDATSKSLSKSLAEIGGLLEKHQNREKYVKSVIAWIERHQDDWMRNIKREDYRQDFKNHRSAFRQFKIDILSLIDKVLKDSVRTGAFVTPKVVNINPENLENPTQYKKALIQIRRQMENDLDSTDIELLGSEERYILQLSMEGLVNRF